jgi:CAAX protease family protein
MKRDLKGSALAVFQTADFNPATAAVYGAAFLVAEVTIAYVSIITGVVLHSIILIVAVQHGIFLEGSRTWREHGAYSNLLFFLLCWPLANLTRLAGVGLPLQFLPIQIRPGIVALVLEFGVVSALLASGLSWQDLGLRLTTARPEMLMAASGLPLGLIAFLLTPRTPLGQSHGAIALLVSTVLVACVGASEEIVFRGLLQRASVGMLGWLGVPFTAVLSAATVLTERSFWLVVYALLVSFFFGVWVYHRRCMVGVAVAHGLIAATTYVIWPHVL